MSSSWFHDDGFFEFHVLTFELSKKPTSKWISCSFFSSFTGRPLQTPEHMFYDIGLLEFVRYRSLVVSWKKGAKDRPWYTSIQSEKVVLGLRVKHPYL